MSDSSISEPPATRRRTLARTIGRYKVGIVVTALAAMVAGYVVSTFMVPSYTATATIVLTSGDVSGDASADVQRRVQLEANRVTSGDVLAPVAEQLGSDITVGDLRQQVSVAADPAIGALDVSVRADDPDTAAEVANLVATSYEQVSGDARTARLEAAQEQLQANGDELRREIAELEATAAPGERDAATQQRLEALRAQLAALQAAGGQIAADAAVFGSGIIEIDRATPPSSPSSPRPLRNALIAGAIALVIELLVAYWRAASIERRADPAALLGVPLLARIPDFGRSSTGEDHDPLLDAEAAEAYQFLVAAFENVVAQTYCRSVLVTSAVPGEGKSLTAVHLARALALQGGDVILVDADLRAQGLTRMLKAEDQPGLVALADGAALDDVVRRYRISEAMQLPVIPAGQPSGQLTGLLGTARYREAIARITATNELTVVDGGPLLTVADPSVLAMQLSGILLVVDEDTPEDDLLRVKEQLELVTTPLIGCVVNRARDEVSPRYAYPYPYGGSSTAARGRRRAVGRQPETPSGDEDESSKVAAAESVDAASPDG